MAVSDKNAMRYNDINQAHILAERERERRRHGFLGNMTEKCKRLWAEARYGREQNDGTDY